MTLFPLTIVSGPWPERIGRHCRIVTLDLPENRFPRSGMGRAEEIILIEDDPLGAPTDAEDGWSCVLDRKHLAP